MKRFFLVSVLSALIQTETRAQFPFYGYELNNYEVGDTLEYYYYSAAALGYFQSYQLYRILQKDVFAGDSIKYTFDYISGYPPYYLRDTVSKTFDNDTVYNNKNNLFGLTLWDSTDNGLDSLTYDTIGVLKRIKFKSEQLFNQKHYEVMENVGIINWGYKQGDFLPDEESYTLLYAHLAHYGIYGSYFPVIFTSLESDISLQKVFIHYDNGSVFLSLSSNNNLTHLQLSVCDLSGRRIKTMPVTVGLNRIDMSNFPKGMYLYKLESEGKIISRGKMINY